MERYEVGKLLGQGNFAKVHHARDLKSGHSVAIKVIDKEKALKAGLTDHIKREISVMRRVKHSNVLRLYEAKGRLKEDAGRKYFRQLIHAVDFCHGKGVYHRDLKPENLLLDGNGVLKVSDFGLSALAVAPEVLYGRGYDGAKADIWSCGVILYVMLAGYLPFHDANTIVMYRKASNGDYKLPAWFAPEVRDLLSRMLDPNPDTRITISEIMEDSWFMKRSDLFQSVKYNASETIEEAKELGKPTSLTAFDIISQSVGLNLSGLFVENDHKEWLIMEQQLRENLKDIVWAWNDDSSTDC
ncbi:CBL-interacting protein kinase 5 [Linum grandiflorum]